MSTPGLEWAINADSSILDAERSGNFCSGIIHRRGAETGRHLQSRS
jgi:hypothetical protein